MATETVVPSRTPIRDVDVIHLPPPDGRIYDFTNSAGESHTVRITIPSSYKPVRSNVGWHEEYTEKLECIKGKAHTHISTGMHRCKDYTLVPGGVSEFPKWALFYWERDDGPPEEPSTPTDKTPLIVIGPDPDDDPEAQWGVRTPSSYASSIQAGPSTVGPLTTTQDDPTTLVVDLSPDLDEGSARFSKDYELFHRNYAGMHLDQWVYPRLPSTPVVVRQLIKGSMAISPHVIRAWIVKQLLSIQLLVLYAAFDWHPAMGHPPLRWCHAFCVHGFKKWPQREPDWVAQWEWNTMVVISHIRVGFWAAVGRRLLGMKATYPEYSPERLMTS